MLWLQKVLGIAKRDQQVIVVITNTGNTAFDTDSILGIVQTAKQAAGCRATDIKINVIEGSEEEVTHGINRLRKQIFKRCQDGLGFYH